MFKSRYFSYDSVKHTIINNYSMRKNYSFILIENTFYSKFIGISITPLCLNS